MFFRFSVWLMDSWISFLVSPRDLAFKAGIDDDQDGRDDVVVKPGGSGSEGSDGHTYNSGVFIPPASSMTHLMISIYFAKPYPDYQYQFLPSIVMQHCGLIHQIWRESSGNQHLTGRAHRSLRT